MSRKQREKDEEKLLNLMEQIEKISWNADIVEQALALAWKYMNLSARQAQRIQDLERRER